VPNQKMSVLHSETNKGLYHNFLCVTNKQGKNKNKSNTHYTIFNFHIPHGHVNRSSFPAFRHTGTSLIEISNIVTTTDHQARIPNNIASKEQNVNIKKLGS
ncbi:MAG: homoaconitase/3-isopropylmalate dehydratase large subunit, partial [Bacillariaceae sp.]|jgi:homoaconitase/3-isopropylmalate dehydratase large subunit